MRLKLLRPLALLLALSLVAAGCGRDDEEAAAPDDDDVTDEPAGEPGPAPGFDGTTIKLGVLSPLSGRASLIGTPLSTGTRAWFERLNAEGGVAGKYRVSLVEADTKYEAPTAAQLYNGMKDDVTMIAQLFGTQIVNTLLPQLQADGLVAQPASLDSQWVREQQLLPVGGPYEIEAINALDYYLANGGKGKKVCALASDDAYGDAGLAGVEFGADRLDVTVAATPRFSVGTTDFTAPVSALRAAGCEMVFGVFTAVELSPVITAASQLSFTPRWIGLAPSWLSVFAGTPIRDYLVANFWLASEGPAWADPSVPEMVEMAEALQRYGGGIAPDQYFLFGYEAGRAVTAVLERAVERGDLSREGIVEAMNSLDRISAQGAFGDYEWGPPEKRNPPRATSIFRVDPSKPYALDLVVRDHTSAAARAFTFEEDE